MSSGDSSPDRRWRRALAAIGGSLKMAAAVLFWDVGMEGYCAFSPLVCPVWILISIVKSAVRRPGWGIAVLRVSVPLLTLAIAVGNAKLQWKISDTNAKRVIEACEEFRAINGHYPRKLEELVPTFLNSVPPAKHCMTGIFHYLNSGDTCLLWWSRYGFYRRFYNFDEKRWSNLD